MDSIIFDLDGTLWDSSETVMTVWNNVLKDRKEIRKLLVLEDLHGIMGLQKKELGLKLFPYLEDDLREEVLDECFKVEQHFIAEQGGRLYDKLEETLKILSAKYKLYIVSNCQDGYIEAFYQYHKLEHHFLDYENPGRTGLTKGENIKLIIERNKLKNPVYVGDTEGDRKAAQLAGIPFVFASFGFGQVSHYDYKIDRLEDLVELFM